MNFKTGKILITRAINKKMLKDKNFSNFLYISLGRYMEQDWGTLCKWGKVANDEALKTKERIFSKYSTEKNEIYIITEADRSKTSILFCNEYELKMAT